MENENGTPRIKFVLTVEYDPATHGSGYKLELGDGFPLTLAIATLEKAKTRILHDELAIETMKMQAAQAQQIQHATQMPPVPPGFPRG